MVILIMLAGAGIFCCGFFVGKKQQTAEQWAVHEIIWEDKRINGTGKARWQA